MGVDDNVFSAFARRFADDLNDTPVLTRRQRSGQAGMVALLIGLFIAGLASMIYLKVYVTVETYYSGPLGR